MKIGGIIALNKFPMWENSARQLRELCDVVCVRFDGKNGDPAILKQLDGFFGEKLGKVFIADGWHVPTWREECLVLMDEFAPDIVLCPDEDEEFGEELMDELKAFWYSDKKGMMFEYEPLKTDDGRVVNGGQPYPPDPHMKAFKWEPGLSYFPYHFDAKIAKYCNPETWWNAKTKIKHYCCYRKEWEERKKFKSDTVKGRAVKGVTLIGFGPSAKADKEIIGEIWSLNNCYEALPKDAMRLCTRIFEMHPFEKREKETAKDGRPHFWHLDRIGREGRRIIMLKEHPLITNSEAYPITEVVGSHGVDWFMGTPAYMVALAIMERYTDIRVFGLDQLDWEHTLQRECFAGWMMYAIGRGIRISGALTWLEKYKDEGGKMRRYGYDWGPEFAPWCEDALWTGHPMKVHYKIPSRVVDGKMFDGKK